MKVLVIGAHPDDEILGVGGTICKHIKNSDDVYVCIVTKSIEPRWSKEYMERKIIEQKEVDTLLNIKQRFNLDLPTTQLNIIAHGEFNSKISEIVEKVKPDIVYTHFEGDLNLDHTIVFRGTLLATKTPNRIKLLCFETLSSTENTNSYFKPNFYVEINEFIDKKLKAFKIYSSEVKKYPHTRSLEGLKILAQRRGSEICTEYAEAFILIRDYW